MGRINKYAKVVVFIGVIWIADIVIRNVVIKPVIAEPPVIVVEQEIVQEIVQEVEDVREKNVRLILASAERWKDVREITGNNDHPMITKSINLCGLDGDKGYAWCASCQAEIHYEAGIKAPKSARVVDWFKTNVMWVGEAPKYVDKRGMVGGMYYPKLGRLAHIVLIVGESDKYYYTAEGNTSATGAIEWDENDLTQREGDGFYKKIRDKSSIHSIADYLKM